MCFQVPESGMKGAGRRAPGFLLLTTSRLPTIRPASALDSSPAQAATPKKKTKGQNQRGRGQEIWGLQTVQALLSKSGQPKEDGGRETDREGRTQGGGRGREGEGPERKSTGRHPGSVVPGTPAATVYSGLPQAG